MPHPPLDPRVLRLTQLAEELTQISLDIGCTLHLTANWFVWMDESPSSSPTLSIFYKLPPSLSVDRFAWKDNGVNSGMKQGQTTIGSTGLVVYLSEDALEAEVNRA